MLVPFFPCPCLAPPPAPCAQLWVFGVAIALMMAWDGDYEDASDQLRLRPAEAAEVLGEWSRLCTAWRVRALAAAAVGGQAGMRV